MKKLLALSSLIIFNYFQTQNWKTEEQYIQKFAQYAVEEMEKYQIPASIKLAQGLLETGGGQSRLAQQGNNHFGIKCKEDWTGKTMSHTDDAQNECFRVYDDPKESYEDHSKFLRFRKFYQNLFNLDIKDYKAWAYGLKKAGYATNPKYAQILISKIEKLRLYEFDNTSSKDVLATVLKLYPDMQNDPIFMAKIEQSKVKKEPITVRVPYEQTAYATQQKKVQEIESDAELLQTILVKNHPNGGVKFIIIPADTDISFVANKYKIPESRLIKWNDLSNNQLKRNSVVFLEAKNSSGNIETYAAQVGETMHYISQKFGIKLDKLYSKNRMRTGEEPQVGQIIYLKNKKPRD